MIKVPRNNGHNCLSLFYLALQYCIFFLAQALLTTQQSVSLFGHIECGNYRNSVRWGQRKLPCHFNESSHSGNDPVQLIQTVIVDYHTTSTGWTLPNLYPRPQAF